jgi:hypothetical protein
MGIITIIKHLYLMGKYSLSIQNLKCLYDDKWFKWKTGKRCPCMYKKNIAIAVIRMVSTL